VYRTGTIELTEAEAKPLKACKLIGEPVPAEDVGNGSQVDDKADSEHKNAVDAEAEAARLLAEEQRLQAFNQAVAKLDKAQDFTGNNKPDVKALARVGLVVTAAERDELWAIVNPAE
jgi:hypothetical protein